MGIINARISFNRSTSFFLLDLGFLSSIGIILWMPFISFGTLTITVYSILLGYGYLGPAIFIVVNFAAAVYWNKARKHSRTAAFDDRLSFEKMERAREWWITKGNEKDS